jgi:hypothetical protein
MNRQTVDLLAAQMDEAWESLRRWVQGLSDEEFFWKPAPDCWTLHPDESGRWIVDYALPDPDPPPFTTIAWRLVHIATCKVMYYEHAFGPAQLTWDDLEIPHTVTDAIAMLQEGHARLRETLAPLNDEDLQEMRRTNWGELWPTWRIFWAMISHDLHHGAEIGCLRDLYRARGPGGAEN